MKFVKLSIFALTMGLFVASCGNGNGDAAHTDSAATAPAVTEPAPAAAPAVTDTPTAPAATPADTAAHH